MTDVYRVYRIPEDAPKSSKEKKQHSHEDASNIEFVCASARLMEAVESLSK
jgi:hypothetical protein